MSVRLIWKRLITDQLPSSPHHPSTAIFLLRHIRFANFCSQTAASSTTPPDRADFTQFLTSKCGLTDKDVRKANGHCKGLVPSKSSQNWEEILELLNGCGLTHPAKIRSAVLSNPLIFSYRADRNIKSKLSLLRTFMDEENISILLCRNASILNCSEGHLKSSFSLLQSLGVNGQELSKLVSMAPRLLEYSEERVKNSFLQAENLGFKKGSNMFLVALRATLGTPKETIDRRLKCLSSFGFSEKQISQVLPWILGIAEEKLKRNIDFLVNSVGLQFDDFVIYPMLFTHSLEKRIIPRYRVIEALKSMQVLKTKMSFRRIIVQPERHFLEKFVNIDPESSSVLRDIYHGGKAGKLIIDKETCSERVSKKQSPKL